jgi:hypothetical protein
MSSVYEENVECPVCHQRSAGLDLNCKTNEQELICHRPECGYAYEQQIVQRKSSSGKEYSFWQVTEEFPMNEEGSVRRRNNAVTEELKDVEIAASPLKTIRAPRPPGCTSTGLGTEKTNVHRPLLHAN